MKYIFLSFQNAAICLSNPNSSGEVKNYVFDNYAWKNGKKWMKRNEHPLAKKTIHSARDTDWGTKSHIRMEQVSNMLHVLCGCRPVPTYKQTVLKRIPLLDEIAKNSLYKIDNVVLYETKKGIRPICDVNQSVKFVQNSNRQTLQTLGSNGKVFNKAYFTWRYLKKRYYFEEEEKYKMLMVQFAKWYGKDTFKKDYSLVDFIVYLSEDKGLKGEMLEFFKENGFDGPLLKIANGDCNLQGFNDAKPSNSTHLLHKLVEKTALMQKVHINGKFIIPIEDDNVFDIIMNGVKACTFLEDGVVMVRGTANSLDERTIKEYKQIFRKINARK